MKQPKVSVIVPVYNSEKYLEKCLDSLVNQTLEDIEIIVVDDGSTDSSSFIIEEYHKQCAEKMVCITQKNSGQAAARNRALKLCRGEYVGFLDSDDYVKPVMFQRMYEKAKHNQADYAACGYTDITYKNGKVLVLRDYVASKAAVKSEELFFDALVSPFIHLYRRSMLVESGAYFPEGLIYEDTAFYLEIIPYINKIEVIEESLAYRVRHQNSTTTSFDPGRVGQIFSVADETIAYYKKKDMWDRYKDELTYFYVKVLLCSSMQRICRVADRQERKILVRKTFDYLIKTFPGYRRNPFLKRGVKNLYIKSFSRATAGFYTSLLRFKSKFERQYL